MSGCIGEPISWLRLERYGLCELSGRERSAIGRHLAACLTCHACFLRIAGPTAALGPRTGRAPARRPARHVRGAWLGGAAAAAAALLISRFGPGLEPPEPQPTIKGGELGLELVRLGHDGQLRDPSHYRPDDRFKALLTCPPPWRGSVDLIVYQDGRAYFPLAAQTVESCGNRRSLDGAFRIDGHSPALVCVVLTATPLDRDQLAGGPARLPERSACDRLQREPE